MLIKNKKNNNKNVIDNRNKTFYFHDDPPWVVLSIDDEAFDYNECTQGLDITKMNGWKNIFQLVFEYLDYRDLMAMIIVSKDTKKIADREIEKRNIWINGGGVFISNKDFWYVGRKCKGYSYVNNWIKYNIKCNIWEEITLLGFNTMCRGCMKNKKNKERSLSQEIARQGRIAYSKRMAEERKQKENQRNQWRRDRTIHGPKFLPKNSYK